MIDYPGQWKDETCFIIGGGPSAKDTCQKYHDPIINSGVKIIVINDAFLLFPEADVLYFGDKEWWPDNKDEVKRIFKGQIFTKSARGGDSTIHLKSPEKVKRNDGFIVPGWSENPLIVGGHDSGHQAINLAHHFGVSAIFLVGFDMKQKDGQNNWHNRHERFRSDKVVAPEKYDLTFVPGYTNVAKECARNGIRVFNMNPDSVLEVFPKLKMEDLFDVRD